MNSIDNINLEISKIKNLPPLPESSIRMITAVNDPEISVDKLVEIMSLSPVLMARLLGLANSAYFGRAGKINELRIAIIQVLGLNLVKSLTLSMVLSTELDTSKCNKFDTEYFWNHSLATAFIAQKLAIRMRNELISPNTAYTSGLLLNIGLLAMITISPVQMNDVFSKSDRLIGSVMEQMQISFGQSQYAIGEILLNKWQLPQVYQTIVKNFRLADFEGEEKQLILLLELSHWISNHIVNQNEALPDISHYLQQLSIPKNIFDSVIQDVTENKDNITELASVISE